MAPPTDLDDAIARLDELHGKLDEKDQTIEELRAELEILKRHVFGRRREKVDPNQLRLFAGDDVTEQEIEEASAPAEPKKRKKKGHGRGILPEHLPRETIELDVPEAERTCADCGAPMKRIGEEITERAHVIPARLVVKRYVRPKYACPEGHGVRTASLPDGVIAGGKYEASVYGHVVAAKYQDHLPLHRLAGIFGRYGAPLPKQTMWDLLARTAEQAAPPIIAQMQEEILAEPVLHGDEAPVTMRTEGEKTTRTGYVWLWRSLRTADVPKVFVDFRRSRSRDGPISFLGDWSGTLISDGYAGYDAACKANGIRRAGCWAHARRRFMNALDTGAKKAAVVLEPIQELFRIERELVDRAKVEELAPAQLYEMREAARAARSAALIEQIAADADRLEGQRSTLPKSELGKALKYLGNQWSTLRAFLDDPRIPIHNNDAERDLRHIVTGRKNWLVFGSERGGEVAARLYSLVLSCQQNGVDPETYVTDVLGRIATTPHSELATLTPWGWAATRAEEAAS
ncbi:MAG: IS66 family transposase [Pseudomonadota bacterium]